MHARSGSRSAREYSSKREPFPVWHRRRPESTGRRAGVAIESLLAAGPHVEGFDVPERVGAGIEVEVTDVGAGRGNLQPIVKRDGWQIVGEQGLGAAVGITVALLARQGQVRRM